MRSINDVLHTDHRHMCAYNGAVSARVLCFASAARSAAATYLYTQRVDLRTSHVASSSAVKRLRMQQTAPFNTRQIMLTP